MPRNPHHGQVRVYFNLHRKCWSVQTYRPGLGWRVAEHLHELTLHDVRFKVSAAGRNRVLREGKKNVHSYAIGKLGAPIDHEACAFVPMDRITYNPYVADHFYWKESARPVENPVGTVAFTAGKEVYAVR